MSVNSPDSIIISKDFQFSEDQKTIIDRNVLKLADEYMGEKLPNNIILTPEEEIGLTRGERRVEGEVIIEAISIFYDTRTGIIKKPNTDDEELKKGDYSVLRTYLLDKNGKKKILVVYPRDWLSPHNIQAAVSGVEDKLISEGQWILPERIDPDMIREFGNNVMGINEPWGKSEIVDNPFGDLVIFRSIELFNINYGPSLAESLFNT